MPGAADKARRAADAVRWVMSLSDDERSALRTLARFGVEEHLEGRRSPTVSDEATISPLASLRFTERVEVGPRANVGPWCCLWGGWSTAWTRVGAGALLSPGVVLVAGDHRTDVPGPIRDAGFEERDVEVGEGAWIGAHATVIGCRVGAGAVVGANAVVLQDVPDGAIAVGSPARVVGHR